MTDTVTTPATATKALSKSAQGAVIFNTALAKFKATPPGFASNRDFRHHCLVTMEADLGVSRSSASTIYNTAYVNAQKADPTLVLGRDPKVEKAPKAASTGTGKRGRPAGSKNRVSPAAASTEPVAPAESTTVVVQETAAAEPVAA